MFAYAYGDPPYPSPFLSCKMPHEHLLIEVPVDIHTTYIHDCTDTRTCITCSYVYVYICTCAQVCTLTCMVHGFTRVSNISFVLNKVLKTYWRHKLSSRFASIFCFSGRLFQRLQGLVYKQLLDKSNCYLINRPCPYTAWFILRVYSHSIYMEYVQRYVYVSCINIKPSHTRRTLRVRGGEQHTPSQT